MLLMKRKDDGRSFSFSLSLSLSLLLVNASGWSHDHHQTQTTAACAWFKRRYTRVTPSPSCVMPAGAVCERDKIDGGGDSLRFRLLRVEEVTEVTVDQREWHAGDTRHGMRATDTTHSRRRQRSLFASRSLLQHEFEEGRRDDVRERVREGTRQIEMMNTLMHRAMNRFKNSPDISLETHPACSASCKQQQEDDSSVS